MCYVFEPSSPPQIVYLSGTTTREGEVALDSSHARTHAQLAHVLLAARLGLEVHEGEHLHMVFEPGVTRR